MKEPNSYVSEIMKDPAPLVNRSIAPQLQTAIEQWTWKILLREAINFYDENIIEYNSARLFYQIFMLWEFYQMYCIMFIK